VSKKVITISLSFYNNFIAHIRITEMLTSYLLPLLYIYLKFNKDQNATEKFLVGINKRVEFKKLNSTKSTIVQSC